MEKILIRFREANYNSDEQKLLSAISNCQNLVAEINAICSYKVDKGGFEDIIQSRGESVAQGIEKAIDAELQQARIVSASIRNAAVKGDIEKYYTLLNAFKRPDNLMWPYLSLSAEGNVVAADNAYAELKESHSYYIKTETGLALFDAHKDLIKSVNKFLSIAPMIGVGDLQQLIVGRGKEAELSRVDYDRIANMEK